MSAPGTEVLRVESLSKSFGRLMALQQVNLTVKKHEVRAVIGPNGAGKSTFFNVITGDLKPDHGRVFLKGRDITGRPSHRIIVLGVSRSFQITNIFPELTVFENVMVPVLVKHGKRLDFFRAARKIRSVREDTLSAVEMTGLGGIADVKGFALSHGDKKRLEIAIVLASKPELLLLDEPTAGMSPEETVATVDLIKEVATKLGITIIFTEHDMNVVFSIADRISVLQQGEIIAEGLPDEVKNNRKVIEAYIGEKRE